MHRGGKRSLCIGNFPAGESWNIRARTNCFANKNHSTSKIWSSGPGQSSIALSAEEVSGFSVQVSVFLFFSPDTWHLTPDTQRFGAWNLIFYSCPPLHHSSRLPLKRKEHCSPLRGQCKAGSFGSGFFTWPCFFNLERWNRVGFITCSTL